MYGLPPTQRPGLKLALVLWFVVAAGAGAFLMFYLR